MKWRTTSSTSRSCTGAVLLGWLHGARPLAIIAKDALPEPLVVQPSRVHFVVVRPSRLHLAQAGRPYHKLR